MAATAIQYRLKGEGTDTPVHTLEISTESCELYDMKKWVVEDNAINKWLVPSMRVLKQNGKRPENGMAVPGEVYVISLCSGSPELGCALPCFGQEEVDAKHIPRLRHSADGAFLSGLIKHTLEDINKWYTDTGDFAGIETTVNSLLRGLCTLAQVSENIQTIIGDSSNDNIPLLCQGLSFVKSIFLKAPAHQKCNASNVLRHFLTLFAALTPFQFMWSDSEARNNSNKKKKKTEPDNIDNDESYRGTFFAVITRRILGNEESLNNFFGSLSDIISTFEPSQSPPATKEDLEVVEVCFKTLGALAYRNPDVLDALGGDKEKRFFEYFKTFLNDTTVSEDAGTKDVTFEIKRTIVQLVTLGMDHSKIFSTRAEGMGMLDMLTNTVFWTLKAYSTGGHSNPDYNSNCDNEGYIIEDIGEVQGFKEGCSAQLGLVMESIRDAITQETGSPRTLLRYVTSELFDPAKIPADAVPIVEEYPELQYRFLEMLIAYIEEEPSLRINEVFNQGLWNTLFSRLFMQIGTKGGDEEDAKNVCLPTKKCFVRLRQKICEFVLWASYTSKEARSLTVTNLCRIATETKSTDMFVISSEMMASMFSHFGYDERTQNLSPEEIVDIVNMPIPMLIGSAHHKKAMLSDKSFSHIQMRYENVRCTIMNASVNTNKQTNK